MTVRLLLADDHQLVRAGLAGLFGAEPDIDVVGQAANGREAVDLVAAEPPDVVLMDLSMPVLDGVEATRAIAADHPDVAVVMLTAFAETERVRAALQAGAIGYVLKDSEPATLLAAVRSAAAGDVPLDPRVARALLPGANDPAPAAAAADVAELSPREREVLQLVAQGLANKQIARRLGITERTVKAHVGSVFRRIGVADRTSAALWARDHLP
ncbi:response regulator transcription factor [Nocardioides marinquilinus]|uniref:Response regulator transcription factor n=1 Tax=Nocardioides marinquilinus TaxID=1210400 RepID=A0ABP9PBM5_9ACTN